MSSPKQPPSPWFLAWGYSACFAPHLPTFFPAVLPSLLKQEHVLVTARMSDSWGSETAACGLLRGETCSLLLVLVPGAEPAKQPGPCLGCTVAEGDRQEVCKCSLLEVAQVPGENGGRGRAWP